jgi:RNA polymerase sigma factor (sigma-70 family)
MSDNQIIQAFLNGGNDRERAWQYLFRSCRSGYVGIVKKNGGTEQDALDALCWIAPVFERRLMAQHLEPITNICGYLAFMVRNEFFLQKKKAMPYFEQIDPSWEHLIVLPDDISERSESLDEILQRISKLGDRCQTLLGLDLSGFENEEIAERFGWPKERVRKERYNCIEKLRKATQS